MIAIKDMEMPKNCSECELKSGSYCYHKKPPYDLNGIDVLKERVSDCPLVEIVTCKDCKYYINSLEHCKQWAMSTTDDFYCAFAESEGKE